MLTEGQELTSRGTANKNGNSYGPSFKRYWLTKTCVDTATLNCHFYKLPPEAFQTATPRTMYEALMNLPRFQVSTLEFRKSAADAYVTFVLEGKTVFSELSAAEDLLIKSKSTINHFGTNYEPHCNVIYPNNVNAISSLPGAWAKELNAESAILKASDKSVYGLLSQSELRFELELRREGIYLSGAPMGDIIKDISGLRPYQDVTQFGVDATPITIGFTPAEQAAVQAAVAAEQAAVAAEQAAVQAAEQAAVAAYSAEQAAEAADFMSEIDKLLGFDK